MFVRFFGLYNTSVVLRNGGEGDGKEAVRFTVLL